jgi:hypothetical protein
LGGQYRCIELDEIIECISTRRGRGIRGEEVVDLDAICVSENNERGCSKLTANPISVHLEDHK